MFRDRPRTLELRPTGLHGHDPVRPEAVDLSSAVNAISAPHADIARAVRRDLIGAHVPRDGAALRRRVLHGHGSLVPDALLQRPSVLAVHHASHFTSHDRGAARHPFVPRSVTVATATPP